jgi:hypothetical protein
MDNKDIVFEDPPPLSVGTGVRVFDVLEPLRSQPGKWARIYGPVKPQTAASYSNRIKSGQYAGIVSGEFEAVSRTIDGEGFVWARYKAKQ